MPDSDKEELLYEALSCYQTGLKKREECHDTERQIAYWHEKKGDIANALAFAERALKIRENALPASHNYVQQAKSRVALLRDKIV